MEEMKAFYDDLKERVVKYGRKESDLKIFFNVLPVIGETEEIANYRRTRQSRWSWGPQRLETQLDALDGALALLSYMWNLDLSQFDLDEPLPELDLNSMKNTQAVPYLAKYYALNPRPTLRQMLAFNPEANRYPIVGTPVQVADQLEELFEAIGGDGFILRVDCYNHAYMSEFVNTVIPVLQERDRVRKEYTGKTLREHLLEY